MLTLGRLGEVRITMAALYEVLLGPQGPQAVCLMNHYTVRHRSGDEG